MIDWMMAHPWMFFFLAGASLLVFWMLFANICDVIKTKVISKQVAKLAKEEENNGRSK